MVALLVENKMRDLAENKMRDLVKNKMRDHDELLEHIPMYRVLWDSRK